MARKRYKRGLISHGAGFPRRKALQLRGLDLFLREVAQRPVCPIRDHAAE
jgi:hypothetical protein